MLNKKSFISLILLIFLLQLPTISKNWFICSNDDEASGATIFTVEYRFGNGDVLWSIDCPGIGGTCGNTSCNAGWSGGDDPIYE